MRKVLIVLLIFTVIVVITLYSNKGFLLDRFKAFLIEKVESSTQKGIRINDIDYALLKGVRLSGITLYKDKFYREKELYISYLHVKFPLIKFLINKTFSPTIAVRDLELQNMSVNGAFGFSVKLDKKIETHEDALEAIRSIWFRNLSVKNALLNIRNINGNVGVSPKSIKASDVRFILNGEPGKLYLEVINPAEELYSQFKISSSKFNLISSMKKEDNIYKIPEMKGAFLNSSFDFTGELESIDNPDLSLYGRANIDTKDIPLKALNPEGVVSSSVYFRGNLKDISAYELGLKSSADYLKIWTFKLDRFYADTRIKDGKVNIPLLSAYPYNGTLVSSAEFDLTSEYIPYRIKVKLSNIDVRAFLRNTPLGDKNIKGLLSSEFVIQGNAKDISSMEGSGRIFVENANLGPMPLLTPLLGSLYGYLQYTFTGLKKIDITRGACDFYIANRKVITKNLVLWGDVISVHARGYVDFDTNLNFEIENKFIEPEKAQKGDWQTSIQEMIVRFGKMMGTAHLTGTLRKPKWKFEYLGGMENVLKGGLDRVLKNIFE